MKYLRNQKEMKTLVVIFIAFICIQAQAFQVDEQDLKQFYNYTQVPRNNSTEQHHYNSTEQRHYNSTNWTVEQQPDIPHQIPHNYINEQNSTDSFNQTRRHEGRDHKHHEKQGERNRWEKKHHEEKNHKREEEQKRHEEMRKRHEEMRERHHNKQKEHENRGHEKRQHRDEEEHQQESQNLRSSTSFTEQNGSERHQQFKKHHSKFKNAFKKLPKAARIAIRIGVGFIFLAGIISLIRCCKRKRQQRRERNRALADQYVQQQTVQSQLNSSNNPHENFIQHSSQQSIPVGQPVQVPVQMMNYQYPQLTNTIISQQQLQAQQPRVAYPVYHAYPQQYYQVPAHEHVSAPQRPVAAPNNQNFMTVELPQLSINNNDQSSRQSIEVIDSQNARRYPVLNQQNPYTYQQF